MEIKIILILIILVSQTTANAPYCFYNDNVNRSNYTCDINTDNTTITIWDEIWGSHMYSKRDEDVTMLTVQQEAKPFLHKFPRKFCQAFQNIKFIDMSGANILTVDKNSFDNCLKLSMMKFYRNNIQEIDENIFDRNEKLLELHLSYNSFTTFPEGLFKNLKILSMLDLSGNLIENLPARIFWYQSELKTLRLDVNNIVSLNPQWFRNLKNLQELDLSNNEIAELPENAFSTLRNLKTLRISSNKITTINSNSFGYHPWLKTVSFESNPIFSIDEQFIRRNHIEVLSLKRNKCAENRIFIRKELMLKSLKSCFDNFNKDDEQDLVPFAPLDLISTSAPSKPTKPMRKIILRTTTTPIPTTTTTSIATSTTSKQQITTTSEAISRTEPITEATTIPSSNLENECGIPTSGQALIVNGEDFDHGSYPWMAVLLNETEDVHCGGMLISRRKVLTAGHCIFTKSNKYYSKDELSVVLGSYNLERDFETNRIAVDIEDIKTHENWKPEKTKFYYDIAVVVLKDEINPNSNVAPICLTLPGSPALLINKGIVIGYGKTGMDSVYSKIPKRAATPIQDLFTCIYKFPKIQPLASNTTFCGGHGNGTGVCTGDSGSGLFVAYNNVYYLRGIVSSSLKDTRLGCNVNVSALYTNVTKLIDWINDIKPSQISTRGSFIRPWIPKKFITSTTAASRTTQMLHNDLPVWGN